MEKKSPELDVSQVDDNSDVKNNHIPKNGGNSKKTARGCSTDDWWLWEIGGIIGSLACLLGIVFFLRHFDNRAAPRWSIPVSNGGGVMGLNMGLNSILSILSTTAKIFVLIPVTKGIGQLKWLWFSERERSVEDIETFESASRGVGGSAMLLWTTKFRYADYICPSDHAIRKKSLTCFLFLLGILLPLPPLQ